MITMQEYFNGRDIKYKEDYTDDILYNASGLLDKVNYLLDRFGEDRRCNSGWRPKTVQMRINPKAPNSKHITADAIDIEDKDGKFKSWCMSNQDFLKATNLYMEHPDSTPTWVHLQQIPPKSKKIVFIP